MIRTSLSMSKEIKYEISYLLSVLINRSIETGHVQKSMKIVKVVPIYKARHDLMSNSSIERIVYEKLHKFLYDNQILHDS